MTLHERIKALPEWPDKPADGIGWELPDLARLTMCYAKRLALAREWIEASDHYRNCAFWSGYSSYKTLEWVNGKCDCGRDELLKALEVPQ